MCTLNLKLNPHGPWAEVPGTSEQWIVKCPCSALLNLSVKGWTKLLDNSCSGYPDLSLSSSRKNREPRLQSTTKYKFKKKPERKRRLHYFSGLFNLPLVLTRLKLRKIRQHSRFWGPWCLLYPTEQQPTTESFSWADFLSTAAQHRWLFKQTHPGGSTAEVLQTSSVMAFRSHSKAYRSFPEAWRQWERHSTASCEVAFKWSVFRTSLCLLSPQLSVRCHTSPLHQPCSEHCRQTMQFPLSLAFPCLPQALQELMFPMSVAHGSSHSWVLGAAQELEHIMEL